MNSKPASRKRTVFAFVVHVSCGRRNLRAMGLHGLLRRACLALLLIVVLAAGVVAVGLVQSGWDSDTAVGPLTPEETDRARATLAADSSFRVAIHGVDWNVVQATRDTAKGSKAGVGLIVELATPVDSEGPWKQLRCQGTVSEPYTFPYTGVQTVGAVLSRDSRKVLAFQPLPSATLAFREVDVANQPTLTPCPRGYEDPEN